MILSNVEIHRALDQKWLVLEPEPQPRTPRWDVKCPYQPSAMDLNLGHEISCLRDDLPLDINLVRGGFTRLFGPNSRRHVLSADQPFVLRPGRLVLGRTLERIELPRQAAAGGCM